MENKITKFKIKQLIDNIKLLLSTICKENFSSPLVSRLILQKTQRN